MKLFQLLLITFIVLVFIGCKDKRFIRKNITDGNISVTWYYESYISDTKDFIEVEKANESENIMEMNSMLVTDIAITKDTIIIKMFEPKNNVIYTMKNKSFGYHIKLDSTATHNDFNKIYQPQYYHAKIISH